MAISPAYPSHPAGSPGRWRGAVAQGDVGTRAQDHAADDGIVRGEEAHNCAKHRYAPLAGRLAPPHLAPTCRESFTRLAGIVLRWCYTVKRAELGY